MREPDVVLREAEAPGACLACSATQLRSSGSDSGGPWPQRTNSPDTVDTLFAGPVAEDAQERAARVADAFATRLAFLERELSLER